MEWLVIDAIYLRATGNWSLVLHAGTLKMVAEITSISPIVSGDILYPVRDAIYLVNKNEHHAVKAISAVPFSVTHWLFQKKLALRRAEPAGLYWERYRM